MSRTWIAVVLGLTLMLGGAAFAQEAAAPEEEVPAFLLEDDEFGIEEGVWSDEFEDGKESTAWFVYDSNYFANTNEGADRDPRYPHSEVTIYSDPINAEEVEGLLTIRGNLAPQGAGPEAAATKNDVDYGKYKVITTDPVRGEFRATLKIAIRGRSFGLATILFNVREHDWKFDGAREARMAIYLANPLEELTQVGYDANFDQGEYFDPLLSFKDIEAEDSVTVQLRRTEEDNEIQFWTAEDDGELEFRGRLGAPIETDLADVLIAIQSIGSGGQAEGIGAVTIDSFSIRGPEVPDVEEGQEDQALLDLRETTSAEYEIDALGRFDYSPAALDSNRAFTWMHFYGTIQQYLLPPLPPNTPPITPPPPGYPIPPEMKDPYEANLDVRVYPRGDRRYVDQAAIKYAEAAEKDPLYSPIARQMEWVREVALERIIRLLSVFRARTGDGPLLTADQLVFGQPPDYDPYVGTPTNFHQWTSPIRIFEGNLPPEKKSEALQYPAGIGGTVLEQYFGPGAEVQTPVDLIGRIPFLFTPEWMDIPLTIFIPDISQEVLGRLYGAQAAAVGGGFSGAGGFGQQTGLGGFSIGGFDSEDLYSRMGRGYTVVDYYGRRYGSTAQVVRDDRGRILPKETAVSAFGWLRDFPGFTDIVKEIIDPEGHGAIILEWNFQFGSMNTIPTVPRSQLRPENLTPPEGLYVETEIPLLVNSENPIPENPRRYTLAEYFGWQLGQAQNVLEPESPNHLAAFDSPSLPLATGGN